MTEQRKRCDRAGRTCQSSPPAVRAGVRKPQYGATTGFVGGPAKHVHTPCALGANSSLAETAPRTGLSGRLSGGHSFTASIMNLSMALQSFISTTVILFASGVIRSEQRVSPLYLSMNARARMTRARGRRSCVNDMDYSMGPRSGSDPMRYTPLSHSTNRWTIQHCFARPVRRLNRCCFRIEIGPAFR